VSGKHSERHAQTQRVWNLPLNATGGSHSVRVRVLLCGRVQWLAFCVLACAIVAGACAEEPVVTLGAVVDAAVAADDDDTTVDEAERERLFRELAERECRENEPVCGADGITYRNYCQAVANGVQVIAPSPCIGL
jgi:hypothetical protein